MMLKQHCSIFPGIYDANESELATDAVCKVTQTPPIASIAEAIINRRPSLGTSVR